MQKLNDATENGKSPQLVQSFDPNIFDGEVRAYLVGGKALSWCLKVPKDGEFLANTGAGATLHPYSPSSQLKKKVEDLAKELLKHGIYFVGLDIISEEVTEINITSPRLLVAPGDTRDYYKEIASWILSKSNSRNDLTS
jgi:glutathione synthase